jgi:hypothetical protein
MRAIAVVVAAIMFGAGCAHVERQPLSVIQPKPVRGELMPIEAMAVFRQAAASADWKSVRSMLAEDDEAAELSIRVQKGWNDGRTLLVPIAQTVHGDVAIVIVSQRVLRDDGPSFAVPVRVLMAKVGEKWMVVDSERSQWQLPAEQADRLVALGMTDGAALAGFYASDFRGDSYTVHH